MFPQEFSRKWWRLAVLAAIWCGAWTSAQAQNLLIGKYEVVAQRRVSRVEFEYFLRAELLNNGAQAVQVRATLDPGSLPTRGLVVDGELNFPPVAPGARVTSSDTFAVRLDRTFPLSPESFRWTLATTPVVSAPSIAITSPLNLANIDADDVLVEGTVTPGATVEVNRVAANIVGGAFSARVPLVVGPNVITAVARNLVGEEAQATVTVHRLPPAPMVSITSPANNSQTSQAMVTVSGTVSPLTGVGVRVNGVEAQVAGGMFQADVPLVLGANTITAVALDMFNRQNSASISVERVPPPQPPVIDITSPADGSRTESAIVAVSGTVTPGASVQVNNVPAMVSGNQFTVSVPLAIGPNTLTARATSPQNLESTDSIVVTRDNPPPPPAPTVAIESPSDAFKTAANEIEVRGTASNASEVTLNGVAVSLVDGAFSGMVPLREGRNLITAFATGAGGTASASVNVNRDTIAPILNIEAPMDGMKLESRQVTVVGMVNDVVPGTVNPEQVTVTVNGVAAAVRNRSYELQDLVLSPGQNVIQVLARDRAGNESSREVIVEVVNTAQQKRLRMLAGNNQVAPVGQLLQLPLVVELLNEAGEIEPDHPVTFEVVRNDGVISAPPEQGRTITLKTDQNGQAQVFFQVGTRTGAGNNQVRVTAPGAATEVMFCAGAVNTDATRVAALTPETQVGEIGKRLPLPWTAFVVDTGGNPVANVPITFAVLEGGGTIDGAAMVQRTSDGDGRVSAFLTLGSTPGINNNVVAVFITGDPSADGPSFTATALKAEDVANTRVIGVVLDHANRPVLGAIVRIKGTALTTTTDAQGQFILSGAPVGTIHLIIDGTVVTDPAPLTDLEFELVTVAGRDNSVDRPIYLLELDNQSAKLAGGDEDVVLTMSGIPGASLRIKANSVRDAQGNRIQSVVTWSQVNLERVPMPPPLGSQFMLAWTVMPHGIYFDPPAQICIPNMGMPIGQVTEVFNFDHDIGEFVAVGTATVSLDGSVMCSDPGFGVTKAGWGGCVPPPPPCTKVCKPPQEDDCKKVILVTPETQCACAVYRVEPKKFELGPAKVNGSATNPGKTCIDESVSFSVDIVRNECPSALKYTWSFGDGTPDSSAAAPSHTYTRSGTFTAVVTVECPQCPGLTSSKSISVRVIEPDEFTVAGATEVDDGDGDANTKAFVAFKAAAGTVNVTAKSKPAVAEADLPTGWTLTGGTGAGKLNRTVSLATAAKTDIEAKCGTKSKKISVYVVSVELVTPKGDPVASPVDSGDGQNEFTFESATFFAKLYVNFDAKVEPSGMPTKVFEWVRDKVYFTVENVGSAPTWESDNPGGRSSISGSKLIGKATYSGLPASNADFGKKQVELKVDGTAVETVTIEVFFPRDATNNPGGLIFSDPNWFYYWKEGGVCGIPADAEYDSSASYGYTRPGVDTIMRLGPTAVQDCGDPINLTHKTTGGAITVGATGKGIGCVAITVVHEVHHLTIYNASLGLADADGDGVADTIEPTYDGLNTLVNDPDTYNMAGSFNPTYASYGDNEVRCRKIEAQTGVDKTKDWANPGAQHKNKWGPEK